MTIFRNEFLLLTLAIVSVANFRLVFGFSHFPGNSAIGIFAALAIPIDLPHREVFVSFNFEANYNEPGNAKEIIPGPLTRFIPENEKDKVEKEEGRHVDAQTIATNDSLITEPDISDVPKSRKRKSLLSRKTFYKILSDKFMHAGYQGETCLLKLICETNAFLLGDHNGALGSLFHIMFSPSTSVAENLPHRYYEAEFNGKDLNCDVYDATCPDSILDLITMFVNGYG